MYCLYGKKICPQAQHEYHKFDSVIRCNDKSIPVLAALNAQDGIARARAPKWCPRNPSVPTETELENPEPLEKHRYAKRSLTDQQVVDIRKRFKNGESQKELAKEFGVNSPVINEVCRRKTYKDVF